MIALLFESKPHPGHKGAHLAAAARLGRWRRVLRTLSALSASRAQLTLGRAWRSHTGGTGNRWIDGTAWRSIERYRTPPANDVCRLMPTHGKNHPRLLDEGSGRGAGR